MTPTLRNRGPEGLDNDSMEKDVHRVEYHVYRDREKRDFGPDPSKQVYFRLCGKCRRPTAGHPLTEDGKYPGYGEGRCNLEILGENTEGQVFHFRIFCL